MNETTVYIAPLDSVGTIILSPDNSTVVIGSETVVIAAHPDVVFVETTAPESPAIIVAPDQINVTIGDDPISVTIANPEITIIDSGPATQPGASQVPYDSLDYSTVQAALDALLFFPQINDFSNDVGTVELGSTITAVTLSWTTNKTMTSLSIDRAVGSVLGLASTSLSDLILTTDTTWTLSASDGVNSTSAKTSVLFRAKRYWGLSDSPDLDNAGVLGLSDFDFATSFNDAVSFPAAGGRYAYYAYPARFGNPMNVTSGGQSSSGFTVSTFDLTNASGHTEPYNVIRFDGA